MFEELFIHRAAIASYYATPLFGERLRYLMHRAQAGARRSTLRVIAAHQANLVRLLDLREGERTNVTRIETAAGQWSLPGGRRSSRPAWPDARQRFVGHAVRWLRFLGLLEEPHATQHAHAREVALFSAWMRHERGWAEETIRGCCHTVDRLGAGLILSTLRMLESVNSGAQRGAGDTSDSSVPLYRHSVV